MHLKNHQKINKRKTPENCTVSFPIGCSFSMDFKILRKLLDGRGIVAFLYNIVIKFCFVKILEIWR